MVSMIQHVSDVMTRAPVTVEPQTSVTDVARMMRDEDIGAVLVAEGERLRGLVSDRDLVVRAMAEGGDPNRTTVADACSDDLVTVTPDDDVGRAVEVMREHSVRRLPVVDEGQHAVGIVSIGDLAIERDPESALGDISAARPNK
jgi:CBS domain-containing protein